LRDLRDSRSKTRVSLRGAVGDKAISQAEKTQAEIASLRSQRQVALPA
jgi:hypothetical protein